MPAVSCASHRQVLGRCILYTCLLGMAKPYRNPGVQRFSVVMGCVRAATVTLLIPSAMSTYTAGGHAQATTRSASVVLTILHVLCCGAVAALCVAKLWRTRRGVHGCEGWTTGRGPTSSAFTLLSLTSSSCSSSPGSSTRAEPINFVGDQQSPTATSTTAALMTQSTTSMPVSYWIAASLLLPSLVKRHANLSACCYQDKTACFPGHVLRRQPLGEGDGSLCSTPDWEPVGLATSC